MKHASNWPPVLVVAAAAVAVVRGGGRSVVRAEVMQPEPIPVSVKPEPEVDRSRQREDTHPLMVEITPLESVSPATVVLDQEPVDELVESTQPAEDVEEPRRRRRRSSAPSSN